MTPDVSPDISRSRLLESLVRVNAAHPHTRKRLLGVDVNHGRELLLSLGRITGGWVGWEATTLRRIAGDLAFVPLHSRGLRVASDVELSALTVAALDQSIARGMVTAEFAGMARHRGFLVALQDAVLELRMAGVLPVELARASTPGSPAAQVAPVLAEFERILSDSRVVDAAGVFRLALEVFDDEASCVLDGITVIAPASSMRGVTGALLARLLDHGAMLLDADRAIPRTDGATDPHDGSLLPAPPDDQFSRSVLGWALATRVPAATDPRFDATLVQVDLFAAATPSEELREVCRRVMAEGLRWDEVEIVTTDPDTYGIALDALCQQLGIAATMLKGIPLLRTRVGRALERWFFWLGNGLPSDTLRQAIEAGDIATPDAEVAPHELATALRSHRVGWGRTRFEALLARLQEQQQVDVDDPDDDSTAGERRARREARTARERALAALLQRVLDATPPVPERGSFIDVETTPAALASATLVYLSQLVLTDAAEQQTLDRLQNRLGRLAELEETPTDFATALAALGEALADLRAWPPTKHARKPYRADGGLLHLTDLAHAGSSGRARTFVVGLDAERTSGSARQDPLIPDAVRRAIGRDRMPEVSDRRALWLEQLGVSFSTMRGRVTLSWAMRSALDGRDAGPSPLLLQVHRVLQHDDGCTFEQLRDAVMPPACAVPRDGAIEVALDARDAWLGAIGSEAALLDATAIVRSAFPMLRAGLSARDHSEASRLSAFHGMIPDAALALDPTRPGARPLSPSGLETLGRCPLQWFYRYGLGLRPPEDPEFDVEAWLDPLQRGSLLHEIFERFVQLYRGAQDSIVGDDAAMALETLAQEVIERWREQEPPPSESVFATEVTELRRAARAFLQMERDALRNGDQARWAEIEYGFGETSRATYRLSDGRTIALRGRADRIDRFADGTLRIVDYKTGRPTSYQPDPKKAAFNGGRLLQPALYADAIGSALDGTVSRFEYRFPTDRGGNAIVPFEAAAFADSRELITALVSHVSRGHFVPTTDAHDCRHCDHAPICRVHVAERGTESPRATWASLNAAELTAYDSMRARRDVDAGEQGE